MQVYVVRQGDSVDKIAGQFNIPVERLVYDNEIDYPYRLAVGQALLITDRPGQYSQYRPLLEMNGYAYPYITPQVLAETLLFLTDLSIFSYGFLADGELVPPAKDDDWMIREAAGHNVRPILVLTPLGADGRFNNNLVTVLVRDLSVQQRLIRNLWTVVHDKGYAGVDVDFEYVLAEDRELFAAFVERLRRIFNLFGYRVTVALAPKTSRDQRGLLYEGIDYRLLGEAANQVMLMTYEWGYTYEPIDLW